MKSCNATIIAVLMQSPKNVYLHYALSRLWKSGVPSKIEVFCWRLLRDRLPSF